VLSSLTLALFGRADFGHDEWRTATARTTVRALPDAVRLHQRSHGSLPAGLADLTVPDAKGTRIVDSLPQDPWGAAYLLRATSHRIGFEIRSAGPDGRMDSGDDVSSLDR
jgi:hypothetical protein